MTYANHLNFIPLSFKLHGVRNNRCNKSTKIICNHVIKNWFILSSLDNGTPGVSIWHNFNFTPKRLWSTLGRLVQISLVVWEFHLRSLFAVLTKSAKGLGFCDSGQHYFTRCFIFLDKPLNRNRKAFVIDNPF